MSTPLTAEETDLKTLPVSAYVVAFTSNEYVPFAQVWLEVKELMEELRTRNWQGIKEEAGDVAHFFQLWLYWRFKWDGKMWPCSLGSVRKFTSRLAVWRDLYAHAGLDRGVSNFCGNYKKEEKVVKQLGRFGVPEEKARAAFRAVVAGKN